MKFTDALGIDISKLTIDVYLHSKKLHSKFRNNPKGFSELKRWVESKSASSWENVLICFEHTGLYSVPLAIYLTELEKTFSMVPALEIKRSMGIVRGKDDAIDSKRICEYAFLRKDLIKPYILPSKNILNLQRKLAYRAKLVRQCAGFKAEIKENDHLFLESENDLRLIQEQTIQFIDQQIKQIEKDALALIKNDDVLNELYKLTISVKGIGFVIASHMLVVTNCFSKFQNGREFACYCGIAPFELQSGTSLRGRTKVSQLANKKLKALFTHAATTAVMHDPEMKLFYLKKIEAGKSKMSVLNIVRNKLVHRIFSVVKRGTPYVVLQKHAA